MSVSYPRLERPVARAHMLACSCLSKDIELMKNKCYIMTHVDMTPGCLLRSMASLGPFVNKRKTLFIVMVVEA